jgi:predicted MFS family arabinose efflux permease
VTPVRTDVTGTAADAGSNSGAEYAAGASHADRSSTPASPLEGAGLLADSNFRWLCFGSSMLALGNHFTMIALPWLVLALTHDPVSLGAVISLTGLAQAALLLFGGVLSDRYSAKTVSLLSCFGCAVLLAALAAAVLVDDMQLVIVDVFAVAWGAIFAIAGPANMALVPQALPPHLITAATSALGSIRQVFGLAGPLLAGWLLAMPTPAVDGDSLLPARLPFSIAFALDGLAFALTCVVILKLRMRPAQSLHGRQNALLSMFEGANWLRRDKDVRTMICYWMLTTLCLSGAVRVAVPLLADGGSSHGSVSFGLFMSAYAAGGLLGMVALGMAQRWVAKSLGRPILCVDLCVGLIVIALGLLPASGLAVQVGLITIWGARAGFVEIGWLSWMQKRVPNEIIGRAMSTFMLASLATVSLSAMLTGVLADRTSPSIVFVCAGIAVLLVSSAAFLNTRLRSIALSGTSVHA